MLVIGCGGSALALHRQEVLAPAQIVDTVDSQRSLGVVTGKGYHLSSKQQTDLQKEQEIQQTPQTPQTPPQSSASYSRMRPPIDRRTYTPGRRATDTHVRPNTPQPTKPGSGNRKPDGSTDGGQQSNAKTPKIITSLSNGKKVDGTRLSFTVQAKDENGKKLTKSHWKVYLNGKRMSSTGSSYKGIYTRRIGDEEPELYDGVNTVRITLKTSSGKTAEATLTITMNSSKEAKIIGAMSVQIDADAVGLGTVVSSPKVDVREGDLISDVVIRFFEENGISYTMNDGYLSSVGISTAGIPSEYITDDSHVDPDTLSEKDFGVSSGWRYSLNGDTDVNGMSSVEAEDGAELVIYYVTAEE